MLQSLDDDTLKDIGFTRFGAWRDSNRSLLFKLVRRRVQLVRLKEKSRSATTLTLRRKSRAAFKCRRFGTFCTAVAFLYASEANAQCAAKDVLQNVAAPRITAAVAPSID